MLPPPLQSSGPLRQSDSAASAASRRPLNTRTIRGRIAVRRPAAYDETRWPQASYALVAPKLGGGGHTHD
jgi:hypothetical protein